MLLEKIIANEIALELKKRKTNGIDLEVEDIADFEECEKVISELNYIKELNKTNPKKFSKKDLLLSYKDVYQQFENAKKEDEENDFQPSHLLKYYRATIMAKTSAYITSKGPIKGETKKMWIEKYKQASEQMISSAKKGKYQLLELMGVYHEANSQCVLMNHLQKFAKKNSSTKTKIRNLYEKSLASFEMLSKKFQYIQYERGTSKRQNDRITTFLRRKMRLEIRKQIGILKNSYNTPKIRVFYQEQLAL